MEITRGASFTTECIVDETNIALAVGSGMVDVFATPMMIAQMELAANSCIEPCLLAGQASVGTSICVSHRAATPVGMRVFATATVTKIEGNRIDFEVSATDAGGEIGKGTHTRFIIDLERFTQKASQRAKVPNNQK